MTRIQTAALILMTLTICISCGQSPDEQNLKSASQTVDSVASSGNDDSETGNTEQNQNSSTQTDGGDGSSDADGGDGSSADDGDDANADGGDDGIELLDGKELFAANCEACHGDLASTGKRGRTAFQISEAIANVQEMGYLKDRLSDEQVQMIEGVLADDATLSCQTGSGRTVAHRLNPTEFNQAVQELFGIKIDTSSIFTNHGKGSFRNNAQAILSSKAIVGEFMTAAAAAVGAAFADVQAKARVLACNDMGDVDKCSREILGRLASAAYRRPATTAEVDGLVTLFQSTGSTTVNSPEFENGIQLALRGMLSTTDFLYRTQAAGQLTPHELASRLSFFLTASIPDATLRQKADNGTIMDPAVLRFEIRRLLGSVNTSGNPQGLVNGDGFFPSENQAILAKTFFGDWFELEGLDLVQPDATLYPNFTENLRTALHGESSQFFSYLIAGNRPLNELVTADYTFANRETAALYNLGGQHGSSLRYSSPLMDGRSGILGHGSILSMTSHPDDSNVVRRGLFVSDKLLCSSPPEPPQSVDGIDPMATGTTKREIMESHRQDPACYGCHVALDPIGFGLESFDAVGAFRTLYHDGATVDDLGQMSDGQTFHGADELANLVVQDTRYTKCYAEKMLTYALGRELTANDRCLAGKMADNATAAGGTFEDIVWEVVNSELFTNQD